MAIMNAEDYAFETAEVAWNTAIRIKVCSRRENFQIINDWGSNNCEWHFSKRNGGALFSHCENWDLKRDLWSIASRIFKIRASFKDHSLDSLFLILWVIWDSLTGILGN